MGRPNGLTLEKGDPTMLLIPAETNHEARVRGGRGCDRVATYTPSHDPRSGYTGLHTLKNSDFCVGLQTGSRRLKRGSKSSDSVFFFLFFFFFLLLFLPSHLSIFLKLFFSRLKLSWESTVNTFPAVYLYKSGQRQNASTLI